MHGLTESAHQAHSARGTCLNTSSWPCAVSSALLVASSSAAAPAWDATLSLAAASSASSRCSRRLVAAALPALLSWLQAGR